MKGNVPSGHLTFAMLGIGTSLMLRDLNSHIEFSEQNIQWQRRRELHRVEQGEDAESQRVDLQQRFDDLLQRTRYGSLISLVTIVERVAMTLRGLAESMDRSIPAKPRGKSMTVHLLDVFSGVGLGSAQHIAVLETLVQIRNCIVHAAGLLEEYEHAAQLRDSLSRFKGVRISFHEFWGQDAIEIEDNFLQDLIKETKAWMMTFYET